MEKNTRNRIEKDVPLQELYCLSGCTAVGKTELALRWAEANDAEILSCDSLLFYRGMDVGTAKPTAAELARVPHHLVDILPPDEAMDIGRYVELATERAREIQGRGRKVLVTGGSGFYLKAFFDPVVDEVAVDADTREEVARMMEDGSERAVRRLRDLNPDGLEGLDLCNPRRVSKALERCLASGLSLAEIRARFAAQSNALTRAPKRLTLLTREKEELNRRIAMRVDRMLEAGLVEEVRGLLELGLERNPSACNSIGYREPIAYLRGGYDWETMKEKIATNTRRLAKKQRTWFRGQLPADAHRIDLSGGHEIALEELFEQRSFASPRPAIPESFDR